MQRQQQQAELPIPIQMVLSMYILLMAKLLDNNDLLAGPRQGLVDALKRYEH